MGKKQMARRTPPKKIMEAALGAKKMTKDDTSTVDGACTEIVHVKEEPTVGLTLTSSNGNRNASSHELTYTSAIDRPPGGHVYNSAKDVAPPPNRRPKPGIKK
ncbi:uncharacterized protein LOC141632588 [Silene latifolia]|uniref:uncharacterized protein LOC141632588 n=1 Tax=Silene latifolia TaxID=37657 RepID=UPI003D781489